MFDAVINNADRKGSHLVLDQFGSLWGFDHGLCAHAEPKLRTVLWGWVDKPIPDGEVTRLEALAGSLGDPRSPVSQSIKGLLTPAEVDAVSQRIARLLSTGVFPGPNGRGPAVPWPPL